MKILQTTNYIWLLRFFLSPTLKLYKVWVSLKNWEELSSN